MYTVYADDKLLYHPDMVSQGYAIFDATIEKEVDTVDSFEFSMINRHPYYENMLLYKTTIKVYFQASSTSARTVVFLGRIIDYTVDFDGIATFTCEGGIGFLNDVLTPHNGVIIPIGTKVSDFAKTYIGGYNQIKKVDPLPRLFASTYGPGYTPSLKNDNEAIEETEPISYLDLFSNYVEQVTDLHFSVRYGDSLTTIYFINPAYQVDHNSVADTIKFGKNLTDVSWSSNMDEAFSVIIPLGDYNYYTDPATGEVRQSPVRFGLTSLDFNGHAGPYSKNEIVNDVLLARMGYIEKYVIFDYINNKDTVNPWQALHNAAVAYTTSYENLSISIKAVKLNQSKFVDVGDVIEVKDPYHRSVSGKYMVTAISIDLEDPANTEYELNSSGAVRLSRQLGGQSKFLTNLGNQSNTLYKFLPKGE